MALFIKQGFYNFPTPSLHLIVILVKSGKLLNLREYLPITVLIN